MQFSGFRTAVAAIIAFAAFFMIVAPSAYAGSQPAESGEEQIPGGAAWEPRYPSTPLPKVGKGTFKVSVAGQAATLQQNKLETLTIMVTRSGGQAVIDAKMSVSGKARDVKRQLPTEPQVTKHLGGGKYLVEGLRFNMAGNWLLEFDIQSGADKDKSLLEVLVK